MPEYYTFEERAKLDPKIIADEMNRLFVKDEEKEEWLKELFESTQLLKKLYNIFSYKTGFPLWYSGLRIWCCYCRGLGHCCGVGLILDPGASTCHGHGQKKKRQTSKKQKHQKRK